MFEAVRVVGRSAGGALVVGVLQPERGSPEIDRATKALDTDGSIAAAVRRGECTGEPGRICEAFPPGGKPARRVLIVGLGRKDAFAAGSLRSIAASVGRRLAATKDGSVSIELSGALGQARVKPAEAGQAFGEGMGLLAFRFEGFKGAGSGPRPKRERLDLHASDRAFSGGMERGLGLAASANISRTLSSTPPNVAVPLWMAEQAKRMARGIPTLRVGVMQGPALVRERMQGLINVGKASENKPCMIRIEYRPARAAKSARPAVLVGKTMTYDTGGLSLKINNGMRGMKGDKDGGCAVIGAMHAIATVIKPKRPVVALLASAENSVSDNAYRPDDIITFRNGVTCEVTNTDAEGRLVLADALCWACERENPEFIVDIATLTGGVVTALGSTYAGMWCDDARLRARVERASDAAGERLWRLPHHQEYRDMMKSSVADIQNSNPNRKAHPIQGAAFLSYFVDEKIPWCHLDIAGVHVTEGDNGPFAKDTPTGFGARLMAMLFEE